MSVKTVNEWFEIVEYMIHNYDIKVENIYNIDKIEFLISLTKASYIIIDKRAQSQFQALLDVINRFQYWNAFVGMDLQLHPW